ncbi:MAG: hypothetical protein ACYSWU_22495, partial [Planctomycetota bacterium]
SCPTGGGPASGSGVRIRRGECVSWLSAPLVSGSFVVSQMAGTGRVAVSPPAIGLLRFWVRARMS